MSPQAYAFDAEGNDTWYHDENAQGYSLCGAVWEALRLILKPDQPLIHKTAFGELSEVLNPATQEVVNVTFRTLTDALPEKIRPGPETTLVDLDYLLDEYSDSISFEDVKLVYANASTILGRAIKTYP